MSELTKIFEAVESGDAQAGEMILPLAYEELRRIAANKMAGERAGHTLQPTALVHEAYVRLLGRMVRNGSGTAGGISSRRPPRRCGAFSSRVPARR